MKARVGDRIVVASPMTGGVVRDGEITEVRNPDGTPPYVVRWSDTGSTGLYFPGPDAHVAFSGAQDRAVPAAPTDFASGPHTRSWRVDIDLFETGDATMAHAVLVAGFPKKIDAEGDAHRNPRDAASPEIGDELAVGRALRRISDRLLESAAADIGATEGYHASVSS
jgi:hypothetical protein